MYMSIQRLIVIFGVLLVLIMSPIGFSLDMEGGTRNLEDVLLGLQKIARQGNLSFEGMRDINEAIARLQTQLQKKSLSEEEREIAAKFKELVVMKAESDSKNRRAQITAAKVLLLLNEPLQALQFLRQTRPNSAEDIEWPQLACAIYIQLGDYAKAALYSKTLDRLLGKQTPLSLSEPIHVDQVQAYRLYTPYSGSAPKPGDTLILYLEVDGARFKIQQGGMYGCNLEFSLELRDELQNVVERQDNYGRYAPEYNGPVADLHATIYYRIPPGLEGGGYTLIITCKDVYGNALADTDFVFRLAGARRIQIPSVDPLTDNRTNTSPDILLEKAKSGDFSDVMDLLDEDLGDMGNDPYNLKKLSQDEVERNKLKAAEIMLERSKTTGDLIGK